MGNLLSLEKFRCFFIMHIKVHKFIKLIKFNTVSLLFISTLFTAVTKETLYHCCS